MSLRGTASLQGKEDFKKTQGNPQCWSYCKHASKWKQKQSTQPRELKFSNKVITCNIDFRAPVWTSDSLALEGGPSKLCPGLACALMSRRYYISLISVFTLCGRTGPPHFTWRCITRHTCTTRANAVKVSRGTRGTGHNWSVSFLWAVSEAVIEQTNCTVFIY